MKIFPIILFSINLCYHTFKLPIFEKQVSTIKVNVSVDAKDSNTKNRILSKINNELHSKFGIVLVDEDALFFVKVSVLEINNEGKQVAISLVFNFTKKIKTHANKVAYEALFSTNNLVKSSEIESKCADIIAKFDTQYLEKERK